jgi:translation initiation factor 4E
MSSFFLIYILVGMDKYLTFNRPTYDNIAGGEMSGGKSLAFPNAWVLWEKPIQGHASDHDYTASTRVLSRISNVEEFWKYWLCVPQPSELLEGKHFVREIGANGEMAQIDTLMLFREGIRPEWEDPANATGGHYQFMFRPSNIQPGQLDEYWNNIAMGIMGGTIEPNDLITGIRLLDKSTATKSACIRIEVWFRNFSDSEKVTQLKHSLESIMAKRIDGSSSANNIPKAELKSHSS